MGEACCALQASIRPLFWHMKKDRSTWMHTEAQDVLGCIWESESGGYVHCCCIWWDNLSFASSPAITWALWDPIYSAIPKPHCNLLSDQPHIFTTLFSIPAAISDCFYKLLKQLLRSEASLFCRTSRANVWSFCLGICIKKQEPVSGVEVNHLGRTPLREKKEKCHLTTCQHWALFATTQSHLYTESFSWQRPSFSRHVTNTTLKKESCS